MKAGISFLLGLLLAFVLVFGYWLCTPHPLGTRWTAPDRTVIQVPTNPFVVWCDFRLPLPSVFHRARSSAA